MTIEVLIGALAAPVLVLIAYLQISHTRRIKRERGALFEKVRHLFTDVKVHQDSIDYPSLKGKYGGYPVKLEPVIDTTAFRKLPVLWLFITCYRPLSVAAPVDALIRPHGTEYFSPNSDFEHDILPGEGWPEHVRIASPDPHMAPPISVFEPVMGLITGQDMKEVLVSSRGVRLTYQLGESSQTHYRVTRKPEIERVDLTPERLKPVLDGMFEIGDALVEYENR